MSKLNGTEKAPVFVCGLARSGSTWLSKSLGQSRELEYIGEAWLILRLYELNDWYHMLYDEWQSFTPWSARGVSKEIFVSQLAAFYRKLLYTASGGKRFIEKTPTWNVQLLEWQYAEPAEW